MKNNIEDLIDSKIESIINKNNIYHVGKVVRINEFVIEATGLDDAFFFEKVYIGTEQNIGYVDKIEESKVYIALVKTDGKIAIGDPITTTGEALEASFSKNAMGMIVDLFGVDRMTEKQFNDSRMIPIESEKIPIMDRTSVNRPLETGISSIDLMFPIGRGQRQLIIGDKKTGKTQILLDTIVNQKGKDVICMYISIGKTKKEIKRLYTKLVEKGANAYTQIIAAFNDDTSPLIKLTPYAGLSMAEEYMKEGKDVLVCIDDLKKHADACREIALIAEKNTGREAYPADIFYTHSRLLEKGCQHKNGGSITILPVVETKGGDITDYVSTNIISITDGQIVLSEKNFKKGQKPAVNFGLSVSRLGGAVQKPSIKTVGAVVRRELLSYLETADVYQLVKVDSMSSDLQEKIYRGKKMLELLKQPKFSPRSEAKMIEAFGFVMSGSMTMLQDDENKKDEPALEEPKKEEKPKDKPQDKPKDKPSKKEETKKVEEPKVEEAKPVEEIKVIEPTRVVETTPTVEQTKAEPTPVVEEPKIEETTPIEEPKKIESKEVKVEKIEDIVETISETEEFSAKTIAEKKEKLARELAAEEEAIMNDKTTLIPTISIEDELPKEATPEVTPEPEKTDDKKSKKEAKKEEKKKDKKEEPKIEESKKEETTTKSKPQKVLEEEFIFGNSEPQSNPFEINDDGGVK